mmetsp:Transcript_27801/g.89841  ORF Transcript_27801/g.89841 Transcript_27801/m.89841 type:complete len:207 (+) Transcript_27801:1086-1706(+)
MVKITSRSFSHPPAVDSGKGRCRLGEWRIGLSVRCGSGELPVTATRRGELQTFSLPAPLRPAPGANRAASCGRAAPRGSGSAGASVAKGAAAGGATTASATTHGSLIEATDAAATGSCSERGCEADGGLADVQSDWILETAPRKREAASMSTRACTARFRRPPGLTCGRATPPLSSSCCMSAEPASGAQPNGTGTCRASTGSRSDC